MDIGLQVKEKNCKIQKLNLERSCKDLQTVTSKKRSNERKKIAGNTNSFGENGR
jgi:hypothetical protein